MILFLDFDGVLHPLNASHNGGAFCKVSILWQILRACPSVEVVFATSWRDDFSIEQLTEFVTYGGDDLASRFIGATPTLVRATDPDPDYGRELECCAWLAGNHRRDVWIALDDVAADFSPACPALYLIDPTTGLTEADAERLIARLIA